MEKRPKIDVAALVKQFHEHRPLPPGLVPPPPAPSAAVLAMIDKLLPPPPDVVHPERPDFEKEFLQVVQEKVQADENLYFQQTLLTSLNYAGYPATEATLPDYAGRLCIRSYQDGTLIVAIDAQPKTEHQHAHLGRQLFGLGPPFVNVQQQLKITRWIMSGAQALAYELGLRKHPAEAFAFGLGFEEEPAGIDERLQQLHNLYNQAPYRGASDAL